MISIGPAAQGNVRSAVLDAQRIFSEFQIDHAVVVVPDRGWDSLLLVHVTPDNGREVKTLAIQSSRRNDVPSAIKLMLKSEPAKRSGISPPTKRKGFSLEPNGTPFFVLKSRTNGRIELLDVVDPETLDLRPFPRLDPRKAGRR